MKYKHTAYHTEKVSTDVTTCQKAGWGLIIFLLMLTYIMLKKLKLVSRSAFFGLNFNCTPRLLGSPWLLLQVAPASSRHHLSGAAQV